MLICAAGDIHGAMDRLYQDILAFEASLSIRFDYVLHVGDFGVWPDPSRIDKATRHHDGAGDFPVWLEENRRAPRPTLFIKGNHEDFVWLDSRPEREVLPGLSYLRNGCTVHISEIKRRGAFALEPSAAAMVPQITDVARIGFKATQSGITRSMRLNGFRTRAAWTSC
jgi:hypothetical protein